MTLFDLKTRMGGAEDVGKSEKNLRLSPLRHGENFNVSMEYSITETQFIQIQARKLENWCNKSRKIIFEK